MDRRTYLRLVGLGGAALTAGCLGGEESAPGGADTPTRTPVSDTPTDTPGIEGSDATTGGVTTSDATETTDATDATVTPPDVSTPAPGACEATDPPRPDPPEGFPAPRAYPDEPDTLTVEDVQPFIESYEAAHRYNRVLAERADRDACLESIDVWDVGSTVGRTADGVTGTVTTRAAYQAEPCETATGTDTPTPVPHADLVMEEIQYYLTDRFLIREGVVVECWG